MFLSIPNFPKAVQWGNDGWALAVLLNSVPATTTSSCGKKTHTQNTKTLSSNVFSEFLNFFFFSSRKSFSESVYLFPTRNHAEELYPVTSATRVTLSFGSWRMRGNVFIQIIRLTSSSSLNRNIFQMECNSKTISILWLSLRQRSAGKAMWRTVLINRAFTVHVWVQFTAFIWLRIYYKWQSRQWCCGWNERGASSRKDWNIMRKFLLHSE